MIKVNLRLFNSIFALMGATAQKEKLNLCCGNASCCHLYLIHGQIATMSCPIGKPLSNYTNSHPPTVHLAAENVGKGTIPHSVLLSLNTVTVYLP